MKTARHDLPRTDHTSYPVYDLISASGLTLSILPLGASIQKISVRDQGREIPLALGFPQAGPYEELLCYAGATLGPNAGRIRDARLTIQETVFRLSRNDESGQLHGGFQNLSSLLWNVDGVLCLDHSAAIRLSLSQPDGLDGYPGNRHYEACYTLTDDDQITILYTASTDCPTYVNLSNHTYWNLTGDFTRPALGQELTIRADQVCVNDRVHLPADTIPVSGTAFDFRSPRTLSSALGPASSLTDLEQIRIAQGYNHAYLLPPSNAGGPAAPVCTLRDPGSGRTLQMFTDAPSVVLYSGGFLPEGLSLSCGQRSVPSCAIALEAQYPPDGPHLFPDLSPLTLPEKPFRRLIQYRIL